MSYASSSLRRLSRSQAGATSVEFGFLAAPFLFLLIGAMDFGNYFITQHSLRTLTSEAARLAMVNCAGLGNCLSAAAAPLPSSLWATAPFLTSNSSLMGKQSVDPSTGVRTITVSVQYPFTFMLSFFQNVIVNEAPSSTICTPLDTCKMTICETTCLQY
nr:TadE/TadG family type IV pilus assembly protein [uncultured Rhodopila sp.]